MRQDISSLRAPDGVALHTVTWAPETDPKAVLLLAHGFAEHVGRYEHVAQALTDHGYAVAGVDHRGHGRSGGPRATVRVLDLYAADLRLLHRQTVEAFPNRPVGLVAHSLGGAIALSFLIREPDAVSALVLSAPYLRNAVPVSPVLKALAPIVAMVAPNLGIQEVDSAAVSRDPEVVKAYDSDELVFRGKVSARMGAVLLATERLIAKAGVITIPTLIVHGTADKLAALPGSVDLLAALGSTDKELKRYEGLYHEVFNEPERDQVIGDVVHWLEARLGG